MRRKIATISIIFTMVLMTFLLISGCKKGAVGESMSLVPADAAGVFNINFKKFAQLSVFDKMMNEPDVKKTGNPGFFKDYQDFVNKTGIDPKKDINSMTVAMLGKFSMPGKDSQVVVIVNLTYNKDKILSLVKENATEVTQETYNGETIFKFKESDGKDIGASFINASNIAAGSIDGVKKVIDLAKGKGKSIKDNAEMKPFLEKMKPNTITSFVIGIPAEARKNQDMGMGKIDLTKAEAVIGYIDYENKAWSGLIQLLLKDEKANQQIAQTLNGLKGMGAMAGPEIGELLGLINITSTSDSVKIEGSVPDSLVEKIKAKADEKRKAMEALPTTEPTMPPAEEGAEPTTPKEGEQQ